MKKIMLMATAIMAMFAIGAQAASAEWYDKGTALASGENPTLELTGTAAFTSPNGGVHCTTATAKLQATGGSTDGHVKTFSVEEPKKCEVSGGLAFLAGGTTSLKSVTLTGEPTGVNNGGTNIQITGVTLHNEFNNGFKLTLSSIAGKPLTATPDNATTITKGALGGELSSTLGGNVAVSGELTVLGADSGTYGLVS